MVAASPVHPAPERLAAFLSGRLADEDSLQIEKHLTDCDSCRQVLEAVPDASLDVVLRSPIPAPGNRPEATAGLSTPDGSDPAVNPAPVSERASAGPVAAMQVKLPADLVDHCRYEILESLGTGGMGAVYKARHRMMDRLVALKVVGKQLTANPRAVERFRREVRAAAQLTHPNIVTSYDAEQAGDTHFLVMELVEGVSLDRLVDERGPLSVERAAEYIRQAARGLQHACTRGMVHRDIKPQNLMLTQDGQIKILDFGLARFVRETAETGEPDARNADATTADNMPAETLTQTGSMMGTPDFMAPEQAANPSAADIRADIYSLGCTFYALLAGCAPFHAETVASKLTAHRARAPEPLSTVRADVPPSLMAVLDRMMAKRPEERYQTPAEIVTALNTFLGSEAPTGVDDDSAEQKPALSGRSVLRRFAIQIRLHRAGCSITLAVFASVVIAGLTIWLVNRDPDEIAMGKADPPGGGMMGKGGPGGGGPPAGVDPNPIAAAVANVRGLDPEVRKKIEAATVFIRVKDKEKDPTFAAAGSGFLAFEPGIVLTNAHVVDMLEPGSDEPESITVVARSGTAEEKQLKGKVLCVDQRADLAVVKVDPTGLPPPLSVKSTSGLTATQAVYVCGFPRGKQLSNSVTIFQGQVASLSRDESGVLDRVVLASEMQRGNSGGPVVNDKGEVVGVNVAGYAGMSINMAVPGDYIHVIMNGRIGPIRTGQSFISQGHVGVPVTAELMNPLGRLDKIEIEVWSGDDTAGYVPPTSRGNPPPARPGDSQRQRFELQIGPKGNQVTGEFDLPDLRAGKACFWQPVLTYKEKDKPSVVLWSSGEKYQPDLPVNRRGSKLSYKKSTGHRTVTISVKENFSVLAYKAEASVVTVKFDGELVEQPGTPDDKGKSVMRINIQTMRPDVKLPEELKKEFKEIETMEKERQRVFNSVGHLDLRMLINERGDIDKGIASAKTAPQDIKPEVESMGDDILQWLQALSVPLPNRRMGYLDTWTAKQPWAVITPVADRHFKDVEMTYTYLGQRTRNDREEALVEMTGLIRKKEMGLRFGGKLEGRALVDLESGIVTLARATVSMNLDFPIGPGLKARGTMDVSIDRSLPKGP
jgi:serine/threonine protein kinase/S1-C subfamily serine protease